jgi:hypothetical protein
MLVRSRDDSGILAENEPDAVVEWVTIARFGNAAEAGYFAHELAPLLNCEPRIECHDDFDAVGGAWRTRYLLTVPQNLAEPGRSQLGTMLDGSWEPDQPRPDSDDPFSVVDTTVDRTPHGSNSRINWVPIMLTLAAGSAVLWAGKKAPFVRRHAGPGEAGQRDLFEFLADGAQPWVQQGDGRRRELRINPRGGIATILEDTDGDGRFDRELQFPVANTER